MAGDTNTIATNNHPSIVPSVKSLAPYDPEIFDSYTEDETDVPKTEEKKEVSTSEASPKVESPKEETEVKSEDSKEEVSEPLKEVFKAKIGENEVEVPKEASITHKFSNGREYTFTVENAVKALVGQEEFNRNAERRITGLASREKNLQNQVEGVVEKAKNITNSFVQGDVIQAVTALARMAAKNTGLDPVGFQKKALDSLQKVFEVYTKMTPEQKELYFERLRADEYKKAYQVKETEGNIEKEKTKLNQEVQSVCQKYNFTEDVFFDLYHTLVRGAVGEGKRFSNPQEIQPEDVEEFYQTIKATDKVKGAIDKIDSTLINDRNLYSELITVALDNPQFTSTDMEEVIRIARSKPSQAVETLNRKVNKANSNGLRTQFKEASSAKKQTKDELDDEMYNHFFGKRPVIRA